MWVAHSMQNKLWPHGTKAATTSLSLHMMHSFFWPLTLEGALLLFVSLPALDGRVPIALIPLAVPLVAGILEEELALLEVVYGVNACRPENVPASGSLFNLRAALCGLVGRPTTLPAGPFKLELRVNGACSPITREALPEAQIEGDIGAVSKPELLELPSEPTSRSVEGDGRSLKSLKLKMPLAENGLLIGLKPSLRECLEPLPFAEKYSDSEPARCGAGPRELDSRYDGKLELLEYRGRKSLKEPWMASPLWNKLSSLPPSSMPPVRTVMWLLISLRALSTFSGNPVTSNTGSLSREGVTIYVLVCVWIRLMVAPFGPTTSPTTLYGTRTLIVTCPGVVGDGGPGASDVRLLFFRWARICEKCSAADTISRLAAATSSFLPVTTNTGSSPRTGVLM